MKRRLFLIPIVAALTATPVITLSSCGEDDPVEHKVKIDLGSDTTNLSISTPQIVLNQQLVINYQVINPLAWEVAETGSWVKIGKEQHPLSTFSYKNGEVVVPADKVIDYDISICLKTQESTLPHFSYEGTKIKAGKRTIIWISPISLLHGKLDELNNLSISFIEDREDMTISFFSSIGTESIMVKIVYDHVDKQTFSNIGFCLKWTYQGKEYQQNFEGFSLEFNTDAVAFNFEYDETAWVDFETGEPLNIPPFVYKEDYEFNDWSLTAKLSDDFIKKYQKPLDLGLIGVNLEVTRGGEILDYGDDYDFYYEDYYHSIELWIYGGVITDSMDIRLDLTYDFDYNVEFNLYDDITITSQPEKGTTGEVYEFTYDNSIHQLTKDDVLVYVKRTDDDSRIWYETADFSNVEVDGNTIRLIINSYDKDFTICLAKHDIEEDETEIEGTMGLYSNTLCFFCCNNQDFNFEYSFNGTDWTPYETKDEIVIIPAHKNFYLRGINVSVGVDYYEDYLCISWCGSFNLNGKCGFLLGQDCTLSNCAFSKLFEKTDVLVVSQDFLPSTSLTSHCYFRMFADCSKLIQTPNLLSDTLNNNCYEEMFLGCTSLVQAPELPATNLYNSCYEGMFSGCTLLTQIPQLSATALASYCYEDMFNGCSSIISASSITINSVEYASCRNMFANCTSLLETPKLLATTAKDSCYREMFSGCTSLVQAPELPATTLDDNCYQSMFSGCSSLLVAPELNCENLAETCYYYMFENCTSLRQAPELPAKIMTDLCYSSMFRGCSSLNVSQDSGDHLIFECPTSAQYSYTLMFSDTCGSFEGSPIEGHSYYWNDPE